MPRIMGIDPGFANCGIVGVEFEGELEDSKIIYADLARTAKSSKKLRLRKNDDNQQRHAQLYKAYARALDEIRPDVVSCESVSFVRNASTMCNIGGSWYGLYYLLLREGIYAVDYTPSELKVVATNKKSASKIEMIDAVNKQWPGQIEWDSWPKSKHEHVGDAAVAAWAAIVDTAVPWSIFRS